MDGATNVAINNSLVENKTPDYAVGINMQHNSSIALNNTKVYAESSANYGNAAGIRVINGGNITATNNSLIKGNALDGFGTGIDVEANTDDNAIIGNITGDGSAIISGDGIYGYGFYANADEIFMGDISHMDFNGKTYGFYARSRDLLYINSIFASNFTANTGLYIETYGGVIYIPEIIDSEFTANGSSSNYAFQVRDRAYSNRTGDIRINTIDGSSFISNSDSRANGFYAYSSGIININQITDSTFTATSKNSSATAFYVGSNAGITINTIDNSYFTATSGTGNYADAQAFYVSSAGVKTINNIKNSDFEAQGSNSRTEAFYLTGDGAVNITNIKNDQFIADGASNDRLITSFAVNYGQTISIDNIDNSVFEASNTQGSADSIYMRTSSNSVGGITINSISNSTFNAQGGNFAFFHSDGIYLEDYNDGLNSGISIGNMINSSITVKSDKTAYAININSPHSTVDLNLQNSDDNHINVDSNYGNSAGINLSGDSSSPVKINGNSVSNGNDALSYLNLVDFNTGTKPKICVNGDCNNN